MKTLLPFVLVLVFTGTLISEFPQPNPRYVDPAVCASCHAGIADNYRKTGMGRSLTVPAAENVVENYRTDNTFYHAASDRYYMMIQRDGRFFQRRHEIGPDGQPTNIVEKEVHYVIGSGNHARSYLHRNERNKLVQLPVTWYPENGGFWAMSPGYDRKDHQDFRRKITAECLFCHNAYPQPADASLRADSEFVVPEKLPEGIDCQRCHGPGSDHVRGVPGAIVNPAKLSNERKLEVCLQCHLESTSSPLPYAVRKFDRGVFSYRPGEALSDYMIHFDHAPGSGRDDKFEIASGAYRLMKSACFEKSGGELTCMTCHNPHRAPDYVASCQGCHQSTPKHAETGDCISCHMPKRRTDDVVHAVMTDHYIQRRSPVNDLLAAKTEKHGDAYKGEVRLLYPARLPAAERELYSAVAQVTQGANLDGGIRRLRAAIDRYRPGSGMFLFELAKAYWEDGAPERAIPAYREAIQRMPEYWPAVHRLGLAYARAGRLPDAIQQLERAAAQANNGIVWNDLGLTYQRAGRLVDALTALRKAVALDPDLAHAFNNLGTVLAQRGEMKDAEDAFREAVRLQPDLAAARLNLERIRRD